MCIASNHLEIVARGGYDWREEVDDGEDIARRSENFGHPVGFQTSQSPTSPLTEIVRLL